MNCFNCPLKCGANRKVKNGACTAKELKIANYSLHKFEEPIISGENGSGTIFFCGCPLSCAFCQNYEVSRNLVGKKIAVNELVEIVKTLEKMGANNINLVSPTSHIDDIVEAFSIYKPKIPSIYNSSGYEDISALEKINPFIDVYMPDIKFFSPSASYRYTGKKNYFEICSETIKFMANKPLKIENGLIKSGLIIRHLILPLNTNDSINILNWINQNVKCDFYLSLMAQYTPFGKIEDFKELNRRITKREYDKVLSELFKLDFKNVYMQELSSASEKYIPKWEIEI